MEISRPAARWWLPPVLRLAVAFSALAIAGLVIWQVLKHVDLPSADSLLHDYGYLGEIVLLAAAAAAANSSEFSLLLVVLVAWAFALAGDLCAYGIGRAAGPGVLRRFGVHEDSSVHVFMARYGARAVAAGRLIAGIRTKLAIVSGSTRMPFHRYLLADALGAAVWAILVGGLGYLFSSSVSTLIDRFGSASRIVGVAAIVVVAALVVYLGVRYVLRFRPVAA
jgi:membrane protein DedA with SNARE-associated domain